VSWRSRSRVDLESPREALVNHVQELVGTEGRVDSDTGEVRVSRWTGVFDVGRVINAKTTASQLRGGIIMGMGIALSEETLLDPRTGRIMNPSLSEYHVPVHADVPPIDVHHATGRRIYDLPITLDKLL
jgi:xanthine dehydrogenase YagR molybdenum-binding subunit